MKRYLWKQWITENEALSWPCPHCINGALEFVPNSLSFKQTIESKQQSRQDEGWDPSESEYSFTAWLKCNSPKCGQEAALVGSGTEEHYDFVDEEGTPNYEWRTILKPLFCWPMPDIFKLPESAPREVKAELRAAFLLFMSDPAASAGRVRVSLERLMDHCRIPKRRKGDKGKYSILPLHGRIEMFSKRESSLGEKLMALKWLGNTASHHGGVSRDDLLNGFEVLEYLLAELFEQQAARVGELARQLIKKHEPRSSRKKMGN